ncbi:MAG TPA: nuclear transport factor 2 family protein [Steroidobacteraceae bacterium]|nr:nuclear transport factor 2 family protein [Steroidobacteraceae bacterium]HQR49973.1 nuclear transport factor 2 family protein [Steroidobacteraceae bacterium]
MNRTICALLAGLLVSCAASAADLSPEEQAVWQLEETYWRAVQAGDVDAYLALWHPNFVGWPCFAWEPADVSQIGDWVREIRDKHWKVTYQLKPRAVRVTGDVATALYAAEYVTDYGDGTRSGAGIWRKFTHTWIRQDGRWRIITGMCAAQEPLKTPRE